MDNTLVQTASHYHGNLLCSDPPSMSEVDSAWMLIVRWQPEKIVLVLEGRMNREKVGIMYALKRGLLPRRTLITRAPITYCGSCLSYRNLKNSSLIHMPGFWNDLLGILQKWLFVEGYSMMEGQHLILWSPFPFICHVYYSHILPYKQLNIGLNLG